MNENTRMPDGTPVAAFDDVVEFLRKRAHHRCPACGHNGWSLVISTEVENTLVGVGIVSLNMHTGTTLNHAAPVAMATCKKCAYIRMHHLLTISKWVNEGKPDFVENEQS